MFSRSRQIELPRRVTALFLLFGVAAIVWIGLGVFHASSRVTQEKSESACLRILGRVTRSLNIEFMQHGEANLQPLVERHHRENNLAYLAVVGLEGRYLAHSRPELVGTKANEPAGASELWGDAQRIRFVNENSIVLQEYRVPLRSMNRRVGVVRLAIVEPSSMRSLWNAAKYAPMVIGGPLAFFVLGGIALGRLTRPVADIDRQLRMAASAPSMTGCELTEIKVRGPAAIGWNRLIDDWSSGASRGDLQERLGQNLDSALTDKLESVFNGLSDGIATTDRDGRIVLSNASLMAFVPVGSVMPTDNESSEDEYNAPHGQGTTTALLEALARAWVVEADSSLLDPDANERPVVVELEGTPSGDRRLLRVTRAPLLSSNQRQSNGHLWTLRDITQQKLAEESRTQFVDTATHELRTPLANIKAYAETLVLADVPDIEQQKDFLNTINSEATRLARFVDDLLSVSSMEVGSLSLTKQNTNMQRLLDDVSTKVGPQAEEKGITFDAILPDKLPELQLDKDKTVATLVNLIGNAVKYTPGGGHVVMRVKQTNEHLTIGIEDNGIGISEDEMQHVFDKFFRSKDDRVQEITGTGIGLSLAYEVVRLHGGNISVESELEKGSTFTVTLPL